MKNKNKKEEESIRARMKAKKLNKATTAIASKCHTEADPAAGDEAMSPQSSSATIAVEGAVGAAAGVA